MGKMTFKLLAFVFTAMWIICIGIIIYMISSGSSTKYITLPILAIFVGWIGMLFFGATYLSKVREERAANLEKNGVRAKATIVKIDDTGWSNGEIEFMVRLTLSVQPENQDSFEAVLNKFVSRANIPRPGDVMEVVYDPANKINLMPATPKR